MLPAPLLRSLLRSPGYALAAVLTLALAIGANAAIFSIVYAALWRPLPYPDADRIVQLSDRWAVGRFNRSSMSAPNVHDLMERTRTLAALAPYVAQPVNLSGEGPPERVQAMRVGGRFFDVLGARPQLGRLIGPEDDASGAERVVVLSDRLWRDRHGADPGVIGTRVTLNAQPHVVIGVTRPAQASPGSPQLWVPLALDAAALPTRGQRYLSAIGLLAPGTGVEAARAELTGLYDTLVVEHPAANEGWALNVEPLRDSVVRSDATPLLLLLGAVGFVLLIACANVANLTLARAESRQREMAVRAALGAGRTRLAGHALAESAVLAAAGATAGVAAAWAGLRLLLAGFGDAVPRAAEVRLDMPVLGFTAAIAVLAMHLVGLAPLLHLRDMHGVLRSGDRTIRAGARLRRALVVAEVALAVMLVTGAGLLIRSFARVMDVDVGVDPGTLSFQVELPQQRYDSAGAVVQFLDRALTVLVTLPGVEAAGASSRTPFMPGNQNVTRVEVLGDPDRFATFVEVRVVTPGYLEALGVPVVAGRGFGPVDMVRGADPPILINHGFARRLFGDAGAVGRRLDLQWGNDGFAIAGVVADVREFGPERDVPPTIYIPYASWAPASLSFAIRARGDARALIPLARTAIQSVDPDLPLHDTVLLGERVRRALGDRRFSLLLLGGFAGVALLLGSIGIYGVMAYSVAQRTREIGVRLALGATPAGVLSHILHEGARLAGAGILLGLVGSLAAGGVLAGMLHDVRPHDPATLAGVTAVLGGTALLACLLPARRAAATPPQTALRTD